MCVERYLAVVHPVTFLKYKPLRYRVICCTAAWIIIIGSCLFSMIFLVFLSEMAHTWFYTLHFLLFFFVQMFFLVAVLIALKHSGPGERGQENPIKRRAFYLILLTTINLSIIYVPTAIAGLHKIVTKGDIPGLDMSSQICFILAGIVQPVLFLHRNGKLPFITLKRHCC